MPVYLLGREHTFPPPAGANEDGVVAVGGDLSPARLLAAYRSGIFPWPTRGYPLLWFSPNPRFVLAPTEAHVSRSLRRTIRKTPYTVTFDRAFDQVIQRCAEVSRPEQDGTWITDELQEGYIALHRLGHAHSVETWLDGKLVGGLYGVALGRGFAGESMFSLAPDASKVAFVSMLGHFVKWEYEIVDCQVHTEHLERFGARMCQRRLFLRQWAHAVSSKSPPWEVEMAPAEALEAVLGRDREPRPM